MRNFGEKWSATIGHGCTTPEQMFQWCQDQNTKLGKECYKVENYAPPAPPEPEPSPVVEPQEPSDLAVACDTPPIPLLAMNALERGVARKTLGLNRSNAVHKNRLKPDPGPETALANSMVGKGLMRQDAAGYYMTVGGLMALEQKEGLFMGLIG